MKSISGPIFHMSHKSWKFLPNFCWVIIRNLRCNWFNHSRMAFQVTDYDGDWKDFSFEQFSHVEKYFVTSCSMFESKYKNPEPQWHELFWWIWKSFSGRNSISSKATYSIVSMSLFFIGTKIFSSIHRKMVEYHSWFYLRLLL